MKIKDITSEDGSYKLNTKYAQSLGLTGEEEILKERKITRGTEFCYVYECILETGDTFRYRTSGWDGFDTLGYPYLIKKDSKKDYARKVGILCKKYNFDFEIGLTLGTEEKRYSFLKKLIPFNLNKQDKHILEDCGIEKRIKCLEKFLGENIYGLEIGLLGQTGSLRLSDFILKNYNYSETIKQNDIKNKLIQEMNKRTLEEYFKVPLKFEYDFSGNYKSSKVISVYSLDALEQLILALKQEMNIQYEISEYDIERLKKEYNITFYFAGSNDLFYLKKGNNFGLAKDGVFKLY